MKITKLDVSVGIFSALACLFLPLGLPVWALFFGWAWYPVMGGTPAVFKKAIPPMLLGYLMGGISILVGNIFNADDWSRTINVLAVALIVGLTVFIIMLCSKTKTFAATLPSLNAFSCIFAAYYTQSFPVSDDAIFLDMKNIVICIGWLVLANVLGLCFGYLSTKLGLFSKKKQNDSTEISQ